MCTTRAMPRRRKPRLVPQPKLQRLRFLVVVLCCFLDPADEVLLPFEMSAGLRQRLNAQHTVTIDRTMRCRRKACHSWNLNIHMRA